MELIKYKYKRQKGKEMRRGGLVSVFLFFAFVCSCGQAFGGAWPMAEGTSYQRLAFNYYFADEDFNDDGDRVAFPNDGRFRDFNLSYYLEYGLTDSVSLFTSMAYKGIEKEDDTIEIDTYGLGDVDLGVKVGLLNWSGGALSVQGLVKVPEFYDEGDHLPLGNGQYDTELRLLVGQSLFALLPGYCNVEVAYRWRAEDPADELRYLAEFGMDFSRRFYGRVKLDGILGMDNAKSRMDSDGNPTTTNEYDLVKLEMTVGYHLNKHWGLEAGYAPSVTGEHTAAGETYTLALTLQTF